MPDYPIELLEDLASKDAQVRWIVHGDAREYLLPEEMLYDAARFCEIAATIEAPSTARQRAAARAFCAAVRDTPDILAAYDRSNIAELVESDPHWRILRERAADVLTAFEPPSNA